MTPTAAAAPSINTRRAFLERCARGDNTARHRINLHAVPLLFSFIHSSIIPLLLLRLIPLFFFINPRFYSGLSLFTLLSLVSSFLSPYSPRFNTPLLFLPIPICSSFFFSLLFLHIPLFPSLLSPHSLIPPYPFLPRHLPPTQPLKMEENRRFEPRPHHLLGADVPKCASGADRRATPGVPPPDNALPVAKSTF